MRIAIMIVFVLLTASFAYAGNIYPVDFSTKEEITMDLVKKEGVEFIPIKGILILENIKEDGSIDLKLVLPDGKVWGTFPLKTLSSYNVDIDRDNDNDLAALLLSTKDGKAKISFKELRDDVKQNNAGKVTNENSGSKVTGSAVNSGGNSKTIGILILLGIVVAGVIVYFFFIRGR